MQQASDRAEDDGAVGARGDGGVFEGLEEVEVGVGTVGDVEVVESSIVFVVV